jgi:hypothetical protein
MERPAQEGRRDQKETPDLEERRDQGASKVARVK